MLKLRPLIFEWKKDDGSGKKLGLIAQELQQIIPEEVRIWIGKKTKKAIDSISHFLSG